MTATLHHRPGELVAGATGPHGRHERPDEGWDRWQRARHGLDPDADTRGRHCLQEADGAR